MNFIGTIFITLAYIMNKVYEIIKVSVIFVGVMILKYLLGFVVLWKMLTVKGYKITE